MNLVKLFGKPMRCNKAQSESKPEQDVGANIFVGNLDPEVDEKILYDTFSAFGSLSQPRVQIVNFRLLEIMLQDSQKDTDLYLLIVLLLLMPLSRQ